MKATRKILACLLTIAMLFTMAVPFTFTAGAETGYEGTTKEYYTDSEKAFDNTAGSIEHQDADAAIGNGTGHIRVSYEFKASAAPGVIYGILGFVEGNHKYAQFYLKSDKVGVELRNESSNDVNWTITNVNMYDGNWHKVTIEINNGVGNSLTIDEETHDSPSTTADFNLNRGLNFTTLTLGGCEGGGNTWTFNGSLRNVKIENLDPQPVSVAGSYDNATKDIPEEDVEAIKALEVGSIAASYKLSSKETGDVELFGIGEEVLSVNPTDGTIKFGDAQVTCTDNKRISNTSQWHSVIAKFDGENVTFYLDGTAIGDPQPHEGMFKTESNEEVIGEDIANVKIYDSAIDNTEIQNFAGDTSALIIEDPDFYDFSREAINMMGDDKSSNYRISSLIQAGNVTIAGVDERKGGSGDQGAIDLQIRRSFDNGKTWEEPVTVSEFGKPTGYGLASQQPLHIDSCLAYDNVNETVYLVMDMFPESSAAMNMNLIMNGSGFFTATLEDGTQARMQILNTVKNGGIDNMSDTTPDPNNIQYGLIQDTPEFQEADGDGSAKVYEPVDSDNDGTVDFYRESQTYFIPDYSYGQLYKDTTNSGNFDVDAETTENAGNIFVYTTTNAGELTVVSTMYMWLYKSTDFGKTWTNPINISGFEGCKQDWMRFCGDAPGSGIVIRGGKYDGRIIFPCYFTNTAGVNISSQSSAALYSDDHGKTWKIGESINEIRMDANDDEAIRKFQGGNETTENSIVQVSADGKLRMYCRNANGGNKIVTGISDDGGETWRAPDNAISGANGTAARFPESCYEPLTEVYCQLAATTYHDKDSGKSYVVISNPLGGGRNNLGIHVREIDYTTGEYKEGSEWITKQVGDAAEAYSSITQLADGNLGLYWEFSRVNASYDMPFQTFSMDYLLSDEQFYPTETLAITKEVINAEGNPAGRISTGDTIIFTLRTKDPVYIKGEPTIKIKFGGTPRTVGGSTVATSINGGKDRIATYCGGSGTKEIKFAYTVRANDTGSIAAYSQIDTNDTSIAENALGAEFITFAPRYTLLGSVGIDADSSERDLPTEGQSATAGSTQNNGTSEPSNVLDNDPSTIWHSQWTGGTMDMLYITIDLGGKKTVDGLRYQPRQSGTNGIITGYKVQVDKENNDTFVDVASGEWANSASWKGASFSAVEAYKVRLVATSIVTDSGNLFASAAEIRITAPLEDDPDAPSQQVDKTLLESMIEGATAALEGASEEKQAALNAALETAGEVDDNEEATQAEVEDAIDALQAALDIDSKPEIDKSELADLIDEAQEVYSAAVDDAKRETLTTAIGTAATVKNNSKATKEQVDAAVLVLTAAMEMKDSDPADKADLIDAVSEAIEVLSEIKYSAKREALASAIYEGIEVCDYIKRAAQTQVDEAEEALRAALAMEDVPGKEELEAKIAEAEEALESAVTDAKKEAISAAITAAQAIVDKTDATAEEIINAIAALDEAINMDDVTPFGLGDVNHDETIDAGDATLVLQRYAGIIGDDYKNYDPSLADVNGDNKVDVSDATLLLQKYAGIVTTFPAEID